MSKGFKTQGRSQQRTNNSLSGRDCYVSKAPANKPGQRYFKVGWKFRLKELIRANIHLSSDGAKTVSNKTIEERENTLFLCFYELHELGFKIQDPFNFQERHMRLLVHKWEDDGLSPSTIQNRISIVRVMAGWMNKGNMIKASETYCKNPDSVKRVYVAQEDKSWTTKEIDIEAKIVEVATYSIAIAAQLQLMHVFGLRAKEAVCLKPNKDWDEDQNILRVRDGTKGGRERTIFIETDIQRSALEKARRIAGKQKNAVLGDRGKTLDQNYQSFYYAMRKFGLTKTDLGATSHGLRHQLANDMFEQETGGKSPVRGGLKGEIESALEEKVRYRVSSMLGHSRISITAAYYGSHRRNSKQTKFANDN